jgi:NAD(P)H dehydrogenase (quinone)
MEAKKILIISAHPEQKSFCMSLRNEARNYFISKGCEVKESDLYAMNFNPVGDKKDFKAIANTEFFKYQMEQVNAFQNNLFVVDVKMEMEKLEWCDVLIFNFPLWWFGLPAILKGWVDRVFAMGFVYGAGKGVYDTGIYKDKTAFVLMTTGGPEMAYAENGRNGDINNILFPIHHGIFYFVGMTVLPPFISWGPARMSADERELELKKLSGYLENMEVMKPIYTNR